MATAIITRTYQDHAISYNAEGWFNATDAAAKFDRKPAKWLELPSTKSYIKALEKALGFDTQKSDIKKLVKTSKVRGQAGTWLHPKLAVAFARWLDDDFAVWCDMQIDGIIRGKDDWKKSRHVTAVSYQVLSAMLQTVRESDGKDTESHHYANEARLVNWAMTGKFEALDRSALSAQELDLLGYLELQDTAMIARGLTYQDRKARLPEITDAWRARNAPKLTP
jgi:hypothetical protein